MKPDCYKCIFRGNVAGDAHSCCLHPVAKAGAMKLLLGFMMGATGATIKKDDQSLTIQGNPHGIKNGWFNYPENFDPAWLEKCTGFEEKVDK